MPERDPRVLVVGGGVAGLEAILALQELAGDRLEIELLAPERHFAYRPLAVAEPFGGGEVQKLALTAFAADRGIRLHRDGLALVAHDDHVVETRGGARLPYDVLLLALGGRPVEAVRGALTFRGPQDVARVRALVGELLEGRARRVAFVVPGGTTWALPLYELALQTAAALGGRAPAAELHVVTPEPAPLAAFGTEASGAVAALLAERGVRLHAAALTEDHDDGRLWLGPSGSLAVDRVVALPRLAGPHVRGVPSDPLGFVPVDEWTAVVGLDGVHAVGDVAAHGIKQGGLATQQADVAAAMIAAAAGADVVPRPYRPVLRGLLLTGGPTRYLRHEPGIRSELSDELLWWPPAKIVGRHLAPYLAGHLDLAGPAAPEAGIPVQFAPAAH